MKQHSVTKNFRSWKSGKKWLYASCVFVLVIGGAIEPVAMAYADTSQTTEELIENKDKSKSEQPSQETSTISGGSTSKPSQSSTEEIPVTEDIESPVTNTSVPVDSSKSNESQKNLKLADNVDNQTQVETSDAEEDTDVNSWMPDKNLQKIVQEILGKTEFTKEDLLSITSINISNQIINNVKGINFAKNLESITIDSTDLSNTENLNEVGDLSNLKDISATNCNLPTVDFMKNAKLYKLTTLDLSNNKIKNLNGLTGISLPELSLMKINNNLIDDISIMTAVSVPKLEELHADYNNISDISPIASSAIINLKILSVSHNKIEDVSYFANSTFTKLEELDVSYNLLSNIDVMKGLSTRYPNLHIFKVNNNNISDISFMEGYSLDSSTNATSQQSNSSITLIRPNDLNNLRSIDIPIKTVNFQYNSDTGHYDGLSDTNASTLTINNIKGAESVTDYSGESYDITPDFYKTSVKTVNVRSDTPEVTYSWSGAQGAFSGEGVVKINWVNAIAPVIEAADKVIYQGDSFNPNENIIGYDQQLDGSTRTDLTDDIKVISNNVDNNTPGEYAVTYSLKNSFGIETEKTIKVTVKANAQSLTGADYSMYVGDPTPTVSDFKASAIDKTGATSEVTVDLSQADLKTPGVYTAVLKSADGQTKEVKLTVKANAQSLTGSDFSMYVGDSTPTVADFKASATDKTGAASKVTLDLNGADLKTAGVYTVALKSADGQTKEVKLTVKANAQSHSNSDSSSDSSYQDPKNNSLSSSDPNSKKGLPQTGDATSNSVLGLFMGILTITLSAIGGMFQWRKKNQTKK
ncbi:hypothetical protein BW152_12365 [Lactococcus lactis]|uniref:bacterial Ig-like domain-containing protein n=1 Tax=Lactococcus lactis TaxID=1358 RepID=UPI000BF53E4D|nr:bacterial Ig-like domain-containing protein [Lactococcus lactis]PFG75802.1 hypothetical protein BW152_12365 [Lactococcus lactis]